MSHHCMERQAEEPEKITCFTHNEDSFAAAALGSVTLRQKLLQWLDQEEREGELQEIFYNLANNLAKKEWS